MRLSELRAADGLLDDPHQLAARYEQDGCLLVRNALDHTTVAAIAHEAASALQRRGIAEHRDGLRWTGMAMPHPDDTGVNDIPTLDALLAQIDQGRDPVRPVAGRVCGHPMHIWRGLYIFVTIPDDPAYVTAPHQDNFAMTATGDYRRLWIALTDIPFADGGLGLALGSHHRGRLPRRELPEFLDRPRHPNAAQPGTGVDPQLVGDHWHTAAMQPGDLIVFHPGVVHRGLPATSNRIRMALAVIASAEADPRPPVQYTGPESRRRRNRVRELAAPLALSELELHAITADLNRAGVDIDEHTVHAAARGEFSR